MINTQQEYIIPMMLTKIKTMVDGGVRFEYTSQELKPEQVAKMYATVNQPGFVCFVKEGTVDQLTQVSSQEFNQ